jgi:threonine synthase
VHTDADVRAAIAELWTACGYVADPHTAIGYLGTKAANRADAVFLSTAHPAKFREVVEPVIGREVPLPAALAEALAKPRQTEKIRPRLDELRVLMQ